MARNVYTVKQVNAYIKEYVHPGLYAEPYLCKRRSLKL